MGSFSVACSISKISINYGDKCVLIPIYKNPIYKDSYGYCLASPCDRYMPLIMPIVGYYNDYGGIEDIEKDKNTELIERYFGISIEDFCECIQYRDYKKIPNEEKRKMVENIFCMFVLYDVYKYSCSNFKDLYFYKQNDVIKNLEEGINKLNELISFDMKKQPYYVGGEEDFFLYSFPSYRYDVEEILLFKITSNFGNSNNYFRNIYFQTIYDGKSFHKPSKFFLNKFMEFYYFIISMIYTNSIFDIVRQGEQFGEAEIELQNAKFYCSILERRLKKEKEEEENWN